MYKGKGNTGRLSIFKGRQAKLNFAVFLTLSLKGPQTIYRIHKNIKAQKGLGHVRYASVNKRVRSLEKSGYVRKKGSKKTAMGIEVAIYELTEKAQLAMLLDSIGLEELFTRLDEASASAILALIKKLKIPAKSRK